MVKHVTLGIFDDHPLTGKGVADFLKGESGFTVLFVKAGRQDLLDALATEAPDVLFLDILAADVKGLELFETVLKKYPRLKVIAYTSLTGTVLVENLLSLGVKGYLNKKQKPEDVLIAIDEVLNGHVYVPSDYAHLTKKEHETYSGLSEREIEVLHLISRELTSGEVATQLNLSVNTIESHRKNIFRKLNVKNVAGMVREAARMGYLSA
jgi:DNA-binding NarL/FixJ family response regulator